MKRGFTLLEVMVAMFLFMTVAATMAGSFVAQARHNTEADVRTSAMHAAQLVLEGLRKEQISSLPTTGADPAVDIDVGGRQYQVLVAYCVRAEFCVSPSNRHLALTVSYQGAERYTVETVFTQLR